MGYRIRRGPINKRVTVSKAVTDAVLLFLNRKQRGPPDAMTQNFNFCPQNVSYRALNATTAAPKAATKIAVTATSVASFEGVFILSGDAASSSEGTDGSRSNQREYRSFTPWYATPSWSRARYLVQVFVCRKAPIGWDAKRDPTQTCRYHTF